MISISTITQNATGAVIINENTISALNTNKSRVNRTATLDGGSVITHGGYSDSDRTLSISARISEDQVNTLWVIFRNETFVLVSFLDGLYRSSIQRLKTDNGDLSMTILIKNREDA